MYSLDDDSREVTLTLGGLLAFVTGADRVPPMDFDAAPQLLFSHDPKFRLPVSSTCAPSLTLPTSHISSYEDFRGVMVRALVEGFGFGNIIIRIFQSTNFKYCC